MYLNNIKKKGRAKDRGTRKKKHENTKTQERNTCTCMHSRNNKK